MSFNAATAVIFRHLLLADFKFIIGELLWLESRQVCTETSDSAHLQEENIWAVYRVFRLFTTTWVT